MLAFWYPTPEIDPQRKSIIGFKNLCNMRPSEKLLWKKKYKVKSINKRRMEVEQEKTMQKSLMDARVR